MTVSDHESTVASDTVDLLASWLASQNMDPDQSLGLRPPDERPADSPATPRQAQSTGIDAEPDDVPMLERVRTLWSGVLGVPVTDDDDFFGLHGTSLQALRVCAQLSRQIGITVPVRWLFEEGVARSFARRVEAETATD